MEIKITGSENAIDALKNYMFNSKFEYDIDSEKDNYLHDEDCGNIVENPVESLVDNIVENPVDITIEVIKKKHTKIIEEALKLIRKDMENDFSRFEDEEEVVVVAKSKGMEYEIYSLADYNKCVKLFYLDYGRYPDGLGEFIEE